MSKQDRQKLSILIVLLVVLGLTILLGYRMNGPAVTAAVQVPETKPAASAPAPPPPDARIRLDLIEPSENSKKEIGKKNVFQYQQTPAPVTTGPRGSATPNPAQPSQPVLPAAPPPPAIVAPPPPPPIPFKYQGYAVDASAGGQTIAFLADDSSRHYNVRKGEVLMGRYRVTQISANAVEVEDIENSRRQMLPIVK